ncbi:MAG: hypothetical protein R6X33_11225, partial [Candidatus Brocadiia bacterium]
MTVQRPFDYGFYLRLRQEYFKNAADFDSQSEILGDDNYFRIKGSVWGKWDFSENVSLFSSLTAEPDIFFEEGLISNGNSIGDEEAVIDNLYLDIKDIFGAPVDVRIGRQ